MYTCTLDKRHVHVHWTRDMCTCTCTCILDKRHVHVHVHWTRDMYMYMYIGQETCTCTCINHRVSVCTTKVEYSHNNIVHTAVCIYCLVFLLTRNITRVYVKLQLINFTTAREIKTSTIIIIMINPSLLAIPGSFQASFHTLLKETSYKEAVGEVSRYTSYNVVNFSLNNDKLTRKSIGQLVIS